MMNPKKLNLIITSLSLELLQCTQVYVKLSMLNAPVVFLRSESAWLLRPEVLKEGGNELEEEQCRLF